MAPSRREGRDDSLRPPLYRSFYEVARVRSARGTRDVLLGLLFNDGELAAVPGDDGLDCSFSMDNTRNRGRGVPPEDAQKVAPNVAVYALRY